MKLVAVFAAVLIAADVALAQSYPPPEGYVLDEAGVLSASTEDRLESDLGAYEQRTTNEIAVATVSSLRGQSIEQYGLGMFNEWAIGQAGKDNGVLLLVAPSLRKVRVQVGSGLRERLYDIAAQRIVDNEVLPRFRVGDLEGGVLAGVASIRDALGDTVSPADRPPPVPSTRYAGDDVGGISNTVALVLFASGVALLVLIVFLGVRFLPTIVSSSSRGSWGSSGDRDSFSSSSSFSSSDFSSSSSSSDFGGGSSSGGGASGSW